MSKLFRAFWILNISFLEKYFVKSTKWFMIFTGNLILRALTLEFFIIIHCISKVISFFLYCSKNRENGNFLQFSGFGPLLNQNFSSQMSYL